CFSTLEDGALAHSLQEQEIEQYYSANVQKNQLVQNDIRIARQLQDEEEQQARQSRASRRLEEQDSEYARMIQEEIERNAEETRRREQEDEVRDGTAIVPCLKSAPVKAGTASDVS
ncbi:hypothetical protein Z043_123695, partial [Scleropages formosus]